jgi:hypothetical protein
LALRPAFLRNVSIWRSKLFPAVSHSISCKFLYISNLLEKPEMPLKTVHQTVKNCEIYKSCAFFRCFQPQNKNGWTNQRSETCVVFVRKLSRC